MYHYTDVSRENESFSLPDVEVWSDQIIEVDCPTCGLFDVPALAAEANLGSKMVPSYNDDKVMVHQTMCPSCDQVIAEIVEHTNRIEWFYAFGQPGCLHDGSTIGPFDTEAAALAEARESCLL